MRILLTGATGFIGRNLIPLLLEDGHELYCMVRRDRFLEGFRPMFPEVKVVFGDLLDRGRVDEIVHDVAPKIIIHMAAMTPVRDSWRRLREFMEVNYFGTVNLVDAASRRRGLEAFIYYSTPEVLRPADEAVELGEDAPTYPATPYAASKLAAESYVRYNVADSIIVRPANTYDRSVLRCFEEARGYFVEKAIISTLERGRVDFDGYPDTVRTWMHVSDHVEAIRIIVEKHDSFLNRIVHVAPKDSTAACRDVYKIIVDEMMSMWLITRYPDVTWGNNPRPYDPPVLAIKGSDIPGWRPKTLREGLRLAISNWARALGYAEKV